MMQITDETGDRKDLQSRRETKFVLLGADVGKVRNLLDGNSKRQIHNHEVSTVRSIYFDDPTLSACRANLDGVGRRRKLRLRWYDQLEPGHDGYLEIKWRDNRVTGKHRLRVRSERALREMSYRELTSQLCKGAPSEYAMDLLRFTEPVVIVEYKREHFASHDGRLRVTIDYDIAFYNQFGKSHINTRFPHRLHQFMVVEGKTPVGFESDLRTMLSPLAVRAGRCSKYVHGCRELGLIAGRE